MPLQNIWPLRFNRGNDYDPEHVGEILKLIEQWGNGIPLSPEPVASAAQRPTAGLYRGKKIIELDQMNELTYYGPTTGWRLPWSEPWGPIILSAFFNVATIGAALLIPMATTTTYPLTNRRLQIEWQFESMFGSVLNDTFLIDVTYNSAVFSVLATNLDIIAGGKYISPGRIERWVTMDASGSHTFRCLTQRTAGTGLLQARGFMNVVDHGPNGPPPAA